MYTSNQIMCLINIILSKQFLYFGIHFYLILGRYTDILVFTYKHYCYDYIIFA